MENEDSVEVLMDKLRQRFAKDFLDLLILQQVESAPTWGYSIIKKTETTYKIKLRHGALYPMLCKMEDQGLVKFRKELQKGRVRKIYQITKYGKSLLQAYHGFLMEQLPKSVQENRETEK